MGKLYFLHIPKTSGHEFCRTIESAVVESDNGESVNWFSFSNESINGVRPEIGSLVPITLRNIGHNIPADKNILITGHLAINPILEINGLITGSIIRNPIDRIISAMKYISKMGRYESIKTDGILFPESINDYGNSFPGFNWQKNIQSAYLTGKLVASSLAQARNSRSMTASFDIVGAKQTLDEVLHEILKNRIVISTMERREQLAQWMQDEFFEKLNINIMNKTFMYKKRKSNGDISEKTYSFLTQRDALDIALYNFIRDYEERTGTLFGQ